MSELRADTITGSDGTSPVTLTKQSAAKAWALFDQVSVALDSSFNIASTIDDSAGQWTLNFTNAMSDGSYSWNTGEQDYRVLGVNTGTIPTTTQIKFYTRVVNTSTLTDVNYNNVSVLGDLA
jgi:hypothetical protein